MKNGVQRLVDLKLEWFECECGNKQFQEFENEVFDERGLTEYGFSCECGNEYHFAYGSVIKIKEEKQ